MKNMTSITTPTMRRIIGVFDALPAGRMLRTEEVAKQARLSAYTFSGQYARILIDAGQIHVGGWERHPAGNTWRPLWVQGPGSAAPKPKLSPKPKTTHRAVGRPPAARPGGGKVRAVPQDFMLEALLGIKRRRK